MPIDAKIQFDEKSGDVIILDKTGGRQLARIHADVVYHYTTNTN